MLKLFGTLFTSLVCFRIGYNKNFFFLYLFFSACSSIQNVGIEKSYQKDDAASFIEEFLFEEGACFTLFAEKPITSMLIYNEKHVPYVQNLSSEALSTLEYVERPGIKEFTAWKKLIKNLPQNHFFFVELPLKEDPSCSIYYLVNVELTKRVLEKYPSSISKIIGNFTPSKVIDRLKQPDIHLWQALFENHFIAGLLYGYGEENSMIFPPKQNLSISSSGFKGKATKKNFPIPTYRTTLNDSTSTKYRNTARKIQKIYADGDVLQITLDQLMSNDNNDETKKRYMSSS